jgi:hypothetical protein
MNLDVLLYRTMDLIYLNLEFKRSNNICWNHMFGAKVIGNMLSGILLLSSFCLFVHCSNHVHPGLLGYIAYIAIFTYIDACFYLQYSFIQLKDIFIQKR